MPIRLTLKECAMTAKRKAKPFTDAIGPIPDEWVEGFAAAVATVARHGDVSLAKIVMVSNGITVAMLKDNGVEAFDLEPIKRAMKAG